MELFKGEITLELYTNVETQKSERATLNLAHENLSSEFLAELKSLVEAKGYFVEAIGANLKSVGKATIQQEQILADTVLKAKSEDDVIRGKAKIIRIEI